MFRRKRRQQTMVVVNFIGTPYIPPYHIGVEKGQQFIQDIGADGLWEGNTLIREYDWVAGYTKVYDYFYE